MECGLSSIPRLCSGPRPPGQPEDQGIIPFIKQQVNLAGKKIKHDLAKEQRGKGGYEIHEENPFFSLISIVAFVFNALLQKKG